MGSTQMQIQNGVYLRLRKFRDDNELKSFTEAISVLLKHKLRDADLSKRGVIVLRFTNEEGDNKTLEVLSKTKIRVEGEMIIAKEEAKTNQI